jgi:hypothetical protein
MPALGGKKFAGGIDSPALVPGLKNEAAERVGN